jgi:hypothetical protein
VLAGRPLLVPLADEDIVLDQPGQPGREDLAGNPEIMGEVIKPGDPGQHVSHDQRRPRVAEQVGGARDRAGR